MLSMVRIDLTFALLLSSLRSMVCQKTNQASESADVQQSVLHRGVHCAVDSIVEYDVILTFGM